MLGGIGAPELIVLVLVAIVVALAVARTRVRAAEQKGLVRCRACDRRISRRATACPHCGDPI